MDEGGTHRACAFCRSTDRKITNEHVIAERFRDLFLPGDVVQHEATDLLPGGDREPRFSFEKGTIDLQVQAPCDRCNDGWMNGVDSAAEDMLIDLLPGGITGRLDQAGQVALAMWFVKTTMAFEYASPRIYIPQAHRDWMTRNRTPPPNTFVWIAACPAPTADLRTRSMKHFEFHRHAARTVIGGAVVLGEPGYEATLRVGALVGRCVGTTMHETLPDHVSPGRAFLRIWPPSQFQAAWPTAERLDDAELERLFAGHDAPS